MGGYEVLTSIGNRDQRTQFVNNSFHIGMSIHCTV